jgi:16S rRNA (guanine1516-N2)-methyltransferase
VNKLYVTNPLQIEEAMQLAAFTNEIEVCIDALPPGDELYLQLDAHGLCIISQDFQPLYIEQIYSKLYLRKDQLSRELLVQAIKVKPHPGLLIIDATAGLAKDALLLGLYGYRVLMLEQNPLLATIIHYALQNKFLPMANLQLIFANSIDYLNNNPDLSPYVVYLDPMFKKEDKALAKKDMQIIQTLTKLQPDFDSELFQAASKLAKKIIVKRSGKQQGLISEPLPSYSKKGKTIRYDVYTISKNVL